MNHRGLGNNSFVLGSKSVFKTKYNCNIPIDLEGDNDNINNLPVHIPPSTSYKVVQLARPWLKKDCNRLVSHSTKR
jgi:hypothetical protein